MAEIISQAAFDYIKNKPENERTQRQVEAYNDFINAKYKIPPAKDLRKAVSIINAISKNPNTHTFNKEEIDWAEKIRQQDKEGRALMKAKEKGNGYIRDVKRVPDDIGKEYGFNFNWKSAYENETGEKLRPNEADAKKLEQYISNKVDDYEKGEDLRNIANNMKMYTNDSLYSWSNFIKGNSNNSKEFQNYLKDMQKIQKDKRLKEIWNGEDEDNIIDQARNFATDFMFPVTKEYAKRNYETINDARDLALPLITDAAANAAMTIGGEALPMKIASMGSAPLITESGHVLLNDKPLDKAATHAIESSLVNLGTPVMLNRGANALSRGIGNSEKNIARDIMNNAANASDKVAQDIKSGKTYELLAPQYKDDWFTENSKGHLTAIYTDHPEKFSKENQKLIRPLSELPNEAIPTKEREIFKNYMQFRRGLSKDEKLTARHDKEIDDIFYNPEILQERKRASLRNKGDISELSPNDIRQLGILDKETIPNYIFRKIRTKTPDKVKNYVQNMAGRDKAASAYGSLLNTIFGTDLFRGESKNKKKNTKKLIDFYGLNQD